MPYEPYTFLEGGTDTSLTWKQKLQAEWDKHGHIAVFIIIMTAINAFTWWSAVNFMSRADQQAIANEKIGILEGKMEIILQDRNKINPSPTPISSPTPTDTHQ